MSSKDEGQKIYADSAYTGESLEKVYEAKKVIPKINEKGYRNKPLTEKQKRISVIKTEKGRIDSPFYDLMVRFC